MSKKSKNRPQRTGVQSGGSRSPADQLFEKIERSNKRSSQNDKTDFKYTMDVSGEEATFYWQSPSARVFGHFGADLVSMNFAIAYAKMIYHMVCTENGSKLFKTQKDMDRLLDDEVMWPFVRELGEAILQTLDIDTLANDNHPSDEDVEGEEKN